MTAATGSCSRRAGHEHAEHADQAKGYAVTVLRSGRIRVRAGSRTVHTGDRWSDVLRFLLTAPRLNDDGPGAA